MPTNGSATLGNTPQGAFQNMASLTNVTFASNNVTRIGAQAFQGCSNLATISLPSSVSYIGDRAFKNAFKDIPTSSVEVNVEKANYVGANAFESTSGFL